MEKTCHMSLLTVLCNNVASDLKKKNIVPVAQSTTIFGYKRLLSIRPEVNWRQGHFPFSNACRFHHTTQFSKIHWRNFNVICHYKTLISGPGWAGMSHKQAKNCGFWDIKTSWVFTWIWDETQHAHICTVVGKSKWYHQVFQGRFHLKR